MSVCLAHSRRSQETALFGWKGNDAQHYERTRRGSRSSSRSALPISTRSASASSAPSPSSVAKSPDAPRAARVAAPQQSVRTRAAPKRRKRRGGTRADQAVKLIESQPGISASDVAKTMKIKPNYLYRVLGDLEKEGRVKKDGRQYYPAG